MIITDILLFFGFFALLIKGASFAIKQASFLARGFHMSEFTLSFFVIAVISSLPEAAISIVSSIEGSPAMGLAILLGSNIVDLTLAFGIIALFSYNGIHVKSTILRRDFIYVLLLMVPILLGFDGRLTRIDGVILMISGLVFFVSLSWESHVFKKEIAGLRKKEVLKHVFLLFAGLAVVFLSSHFMLAYAEGLSREFGVSDLIIGLVVIAMGTCLPELFFGLRAVREKHDEFALGDILGTVIIDATIMLGIVALIRPFSFEPVLIYVTGLGMLVSGILVIVFIKIGKILTKKEGIALLFLYLLFLVTELLLLKGAF
jgi:cation:H+ antiporter